MNYRCIVIDPYERSVYELESEGDCAEILRLISNDEGDTPCDLFSGVNFGGSTTGYVDDSGNWTQFAWFALVGDARLFCGRMVMQGSTFDGEVASLDADITTASVMDKVVWLDDEGAIEHAQKYTDAMAESASQSEIPVISLDDGLVERIEEAIENKRRKQRQRLAARSYRSISDNDDYPHTGTVLIYETGRSHRPLPKCLDHVNHSPDGFAWGYGGSGPAQLAYAILFDVTDDRDKSQRFYQDYKWAVVARLPREPWTITAESVLEWLFKAESSARKQQQKA
jgi:hypothetical protein